MPCYDPPPEWEDDVRRDTMEAAKILCAMVEGAPSYLMVPKPILAWYLSHRRIDLRIADDPRMPAVSKLGRENIERDIHAVEDALKTTEESDEAAD